MKTILLATIVALLIPLIITTAFAQVPVPTFETAYFKGNNGTYQIPYQLINATLKTSLLDLPAKELFFEINPTSNGQLTVVLPRTIIDSKNGQEDIPYFVSIYDIRSLGGPMRIAPQELNEKDQRIVQINFTSDISEIAIAGTWFAENNSTNPSNWNPFDSFSPLQQFKSGTPALDVKCNDGLQLILKAEDASPACVKPDTAQILTERGWAWNYANVVGKESISLSAYQGVSDETFYNNGTVASNFTINVNINNFKPSNASLVLQVYYNDGILYKTVSVPSGMIQPDGFYKYQLIAVSDENHPVPFKVVATYNNETTIAYAPVFAHP